MKTVGVVALNDEHAWLVNVDYHVVNENTILVDQLEFGVESPRVNGDTYELIVLRPNRRYEARVRLDPWDRYYAVLSPGN